MRELKSSDSTSTASASSARRRLRESSSFVSTTVCAPPLRGDKATSSPTEIEVEVSVLRPKEIQSRIRAGASVEQVATAAGRDIGRVERFAHPVLLERSRAAELATAAHPVLADGPRC